MYRQYIELYTFCSAGMKSPLSLTRLSSWAQSWGPAGTSPGPGEWLGNISLHNRTCYFCKGRIFYPSNVYEMLRRMSERII